MAGYNLEFRSQLIADGFTFVGKNMSLLEGLQLLESPLIGESLLTSLFTFLLISIRLT